MRAGVVERRGDHRFDATVDLRHLRVVALPVEREPAGLERRQRQHVGPAGEVDRQLQLGGELDAVQRHQPGQCSATSSSVRIRSGRPCGHRRDHDLVGGGALDQRADASGDGRRAADDAVRRHRPGQLEVRMDGRLGGREQRRAPVRPDPEHGEAGRAGEELGLLVRFGGEHASRDDGVGLGQVGRRHERVPVDRERLQRPRHVEVVGEGEAESELAGEAGGEVARAEQHDRRPARRRRGRPQPGPRSGSTRASPSQPMISTRSRGKVSAVMSGCAAAPSP